MPKHETNTFNCMKQIHLTEKRYQKIPFFKIFNIKKKKKKKKKIQLNTASIIQN